MSVSPSLLLAVGILWDRHWRETRGSMICGYCVYNDIMEDHQWDKFHHWSFTD